MSHLLETQVPHVYLIGDLLSQYYLETNDFTAPAESYQRLKHKGNIKQAMRDGVFLAEVVKQRLEGRASIEVVINDADVGEPEPFDDPVKTVVIDLRESAHPRELHPRPPGSRAHDRRRRGRRGVPPSASTA